MKSDPPNKFRNRTHPVLGTDDSYGMSGWFEFPNPKGLSFPQLNCMVSDGDEVITWEHVSVSTDRRCPTWEEMCFIKSQFWNDDEVVMQLHVAAKDHINFHPYCLHMWKPRFGATEIPLPPKECIA